MNYTLKITLENETGQVFNLSSRQAIFMENNVWTAIDNESGDGNVELFKDPHDGIKYLLGQLQP